MAAPHGTAASANEVGFTVGTEAGDSITVAVQFKINGVDPAARTVALCWLSSDSAGDTVATDPGTLAVGTDGTILVELTANLVFLAVSEADGDLDIAIGHTSTSGFYLNVAPLASGRVFTSPIIQFAA